jgi:hypothetical protein
VVGVIQDIEIPYKSSGDLVPDSGNPKLGNFANFEKVLNGQNICVLELRLAPNCATHSQF